EATSWCMAGVYRRRAGRRASSAGDRVGGRLAAHGGRLHARRCGREPRQGRTRTTRIAGDVMSDSVKFQLDEARMPTAWYNLAADLPTPPPPPLHPGTLEPLGPDALAPLFPMSLIEQEVSTEREIEIPGPVRDVYRQWRPSP